MAALRLMTFNVQMLPLIPLTVQGQSDDAVERADRVAEAILSIPVSERPHVIAFNEVFNEDGRDRLKTRLGNWPNMVVKIDNGGLDNDSGLMLVSRLPFLTLRTGGVLYEHFYSVAEGTDALACKAVGIVQVNRPAEITTIAFTHLQASYATEDEHREVREKQFEEIVAALSAVLGPDAAEWQNVILVGDLNVRGDSGAETDEWSLTFKTSGTPFQMAFLDGWRSWMHAPGDQRDLDRRAYSRTVGIRRTPASAGRTSSRRFARARPPCSRACAGSLSWTTSRSATSRRTCRPPHGSPSFLDR